MYTQKEYQISGLKGLSDKQIDAHLGLYAGYVKNVNGLLEKLELGRKQGWDDIAMAELVRRFGFEFNGMRLHEYYFDQLVPGHTGIEGGEKFRVAVEEVFGDFDLWKKDFVRIGKMRGIGWVLTVRDKEHIFNTWVSDHEIGHLGGVEILLAMDVWEHAFLLDYLPSERGNYIDAFFTNIRWDIVDTRV